jgi:peptidoglycan/LPS O-acetylase OafA/YrhL
MLSLDRKKNDTSITLDALRAIAAQMVCVGHGLSFLSAASWLRPPFFPYAQNIGVLIFFIMSGFLITATLVQNSRNPDYGFGRYFIDRFARIYSGLLPALAFIAIVDGLTIWLTSEPSIKEGYNLRALVSNLEMLEAYRGVFDHSYLGAHAFGSASQFWTLAIEWHIYMFAGAVFFLLKGRGWRLPLIAIGLFFGQAAFHFLFGSFQADGVGQALFALWLGGAALYALLSRFSVPFWLGIAILFSSASCYALMIVPGHEYAAASYPALVLVVGSLIAITQSTNVIGSAKLIRIAADCSFTLYLIHLTLMVMVYYVFPAARGWDVFFAVVILANVLAYLIARPFEMRHREFAAWLAGLFSLGITRRNVSPPEGSSQ